VNLWVAVILSQVYILLVVRDLGICSRQLALQSIEVCYDRREEPTDDRPVGN